MWETQTGLDLVDRFNHGLDALVLSYQSSDELYLMTGCDEKRDTVDKYEVSG